MKKFTTLLTITALLFGTANVFADENGGSETSTATVGFIANTNPTDPVDPWNPDEPGTQPGTGMEGPLSLDVVPNLNFGTNTITGNIETYNSKTISPYIQVTDTRGTFTGWSVTASLSAFTAADANTIDDAILTFNNSTIKTNSSNTSGAPVSTTFHRLVANGTPQNIMYADPTKGAGTWIQAWLASSADAEENTNVTLEIDTAKASAKNYSADLTWNLAVLP